MRIIVHAIVAAACSLAVAAKAEEPTFQLRDGDRVTLLGGGFIERMQLDGYLETVLTARLPNLNVTYRNVGWSGDTVYGEARGVFGSQADGFKRLIHDVNLTKPTVILIAYGNNAAHDGDAGMARFEKGLNSLLDQLAATKARLVLLSPVKRENLGPPLPDPSKYNLAVEQYAEIVQRTATARELSYIDLNPLAERDSDNRPLTPEDRLTEDSLTFTDYGAWKAANRIASALGAAPIATEIAVDINKNQVLAQGAVAAELKVAEKATTFELHFSQLPYPALPEHAPVGAGGVSNSPRLKVTGLEKGVYRLLIGEREVARGSDQSWNDGISYSTGPDHMQIEKLRTAINVKNELFFNRHRPQNETYLFLFRKHEQGNNAVEIPQFDPLIEIKEREIAELRTPQRHRYVLERVK